MQHAISAIHTCILRDHLLCFVTNYPLQVQQLAAEGIVHNVVISPGPGTPSRPQDVGCVVQLLSECDNIPILGVCLGHQALAVAHGGAVVPAPEPVHGRLSGIAHNGHDLFAGIPSSAAEGFSAVRYHSLLVDAATLPLCLHPICWTDGGDYALALSAGEASETDGDCHGHRGSRQVVAENAQAGLLMGIAHTDRPHYGVQFHPESIATPHGARLLANFAQLTMQHLQLTTPPQLRPAPSLLASKAHAQIGAAPAPDNSSADARRHGAHVSHTADAAKGKAPNVQALHIRHEKMACGANMPGGADIMHALGWAGNADTFWLDSSDTQRGRFSYLGGPGGHLWRRITYKVASSKGCTNAQEYSGDGVSQHPAVGSVTITAADGSALQQPGHFHSWLDRFLARHRLADNAEDVRLPFDFCGGLVGYVGYELKSECGGSAAHSSRCASSTH